MNKKLNKILFFLFLGFIFLLNTSLLLGEVFGNDVWLHLAAGRWICENFKIPTEQLFSYSIIGKEWIDHEWLFQIIIFLIHKIFNFNGLILFRIGIFFLIMLLGLKQLNKINLYSFAAVSVSFILAITLNTRCLIRPELLSLLFSALFIYIFKRHLNDRLFWFLIPIQIIWVNTHGFFVLGLFITIFFIFCRSIQERIYVFNWNKNYLLKKEEKKKVFYLLFFLILVCFINPYGLKMIIYPFTALFDNISSKTINFISELTPVNLFDVIFTQKYISTITLTLILFFLVFLAGIREIDIFYGGLCLISFFSTLIFNRNVAFFAVFTYFFLLDIFSKDKISIGTNFYNSIISKFKISLLIIVCVIPFVMIKYPIVFLKSSYTYGSKGLIKKNVLGGSKKENIEDAASFIKEHNISGPIFNTMNEGGQLIWYLFPAYKVYIDGRTELYKERNSLRVKNNTDEEKYKERISEVVSEGKFNCAVLFLSGKSYSEAIAEVLYKKDDWVLVFFDREIMIFLRDNERNKSLIERYRIDLAEYNNYPSEAQKKMARERISLPQNYLKTEDFLLKLGFVNRAKEELKVLLDIAPHFSEAHNRLGLFHALQNDFSSALVEFEKAITYSVHSNADYYYNAAMAYKHLGNLNSALKYLKFSMEIDPKDADTLAEFEFIKSKAGS